MRRVKIFDSNNAIYIFIAINIFIKNWYFIDKNHSLAWYYCAFQQRGLICRLRFGIPRAQMSRPQYNQIQKNA